MSSGEAGPGSVTGASSPARAWPFGNFEFPLHIVKFTVIVQVVLTDPFDLNHSSFFMSTETDTNFYSVGPCQWAATVQYSTVRQSINCDINNSLLIQPFISLI
jgi:hypothetical protein